MVGGSMAKGSMCGSKRRAAAEAVLEESRVIPRRRKRAAYVVVVGDVSGCGASFLVSFSYLLLRIVISVSSFLFIFVLSPWPSSPPLRTLVSLLYVWCVDLVASPPLRSLTLLTPPVVVNVVRISCRNATVVLPSNAPPLSTGHLKCVPNVFFLSLSLLSFGNAVYLLQYLVVNVSVRT